MRVAPATTDRRTDNGAAHLEIEPYQSELLPASRIMLVRFALDEVEQPTDDDRLDPLA
jgi:hypothetical protein